MDKILPLIAWLVVALQLAGFGRVFLVSRREHAHVPEAFIELHIVAGLNLLVLIASIWLARWAPSVGWWVVRALAGLSLLALLVAHLRDRL